MKKRRLLVLYALIFVLVFCTAAKSVFSDNDPDPQFGVNEDGLTYGPAGGKEDPDEEPDLILTHASNGKIGYAYKTDLDADINEITTLEKAQAYQAEADQKFREAKEKDPAVTEIIWRTVNVYEKDGRTKIGEFEIVYSPGSSYYLDEDGNRTDENGNLVDEDGNLI